MLKREQPSLAAALLFLAHPMHVESICPIVGRADCLCGVFYLAALLVYRRSTQTTGKARDWIHGIYHGICLILRCLHVYTNQSPKQHGLVVV